MSEQKLAEFMGWNKEAMFLHSPFSDWDWRTVMKVEARLREKGLWGAYMNKLSRELCPGLPYDASGKIVSALMAATLEQRMKAALQVIQEQACPKCKNGKIDIPDPAAGEPDVIDCPTCTIQESNDDS